MQARTHTRTQTLLMAYKAMSNVSDLHANFESDTGETAKLPWREAE